MKLKRHIPILLLLAMVFALLPARAEAVGYLPGVTAEMTDPAYWAAAMDAPDALLATAEDIAGINTAALVTAGTNMHDLRNLPETFDGLARCESLQKGAAADAAYYLGWTWDETGKKLEQADFDPIIANCADPNAAAEMPLRYGVAVNRTVLTAFPTAHQILDDPADCDFDYQPIVGIRVNEPVAVFTTSADGEFYQIYSSCCSGWVRSEDIAICADRAEWLSAWDLPAEKRLVFWGDKMYTDFSNTHPETSHRLLTMGTVLERMDELDPGRAGHEPPPPAQLCRLSARAQRRRQLFESPRAPQRPGEAQRGLSASDRRQPGRRGAGLPGRRLRLGRRAL